MIDFKLYLQKERSLSAATMDQYLTEKLGEYQGLDGFFAKLMGEIREYNLRGGKMHRPLLTRLAYAVVGGKKNSSLIRVSVGMELLHRYFLAHDDILDQDLYRHGAKTLQKQYAERFKRWYPEREDQTYSLGIQMVGGDIIHALVYQCVAESGFDNEIKLRVIEGIVRDMLETCAGWLLEMNLKQMSLSQVNEAQIKRAMSLVSSQYSVLWPLRIGQILAGKRTYLPGLETYGKYVGWAFQLQDDLLGMFGKTEKTGKPVGSDYREGKKTLFLLKAHQRADKKSKQLLESTLGKQLTRGELSQVQTIIKQTGAYAEAVSEAKSYALKGLTALISVNTNQNKAGVEKLEALAKYLAKRDF